MPQRISASSHEYAGRQLAKGDPFECEAAHVTLLLALGRIVPEKGEPGYVEQAEAPSRRRRAAA